MDSTILYQSHYRRRVDIEEVDEKPTKQFFEVEENVSKIVVDSPFVLHHLFRSIFWSERNLLPIVGKVCQELFPQSSL